MRHLAALALFLVGIAQVGFAQANNQTGPDDGEQHAINQLRAIAEAIKKCPAANPSLGPEMDAEGFSLVDGPPVNVLWNVELHPSIRARYIGSIEYAVPSYMNLPVDDSYCNKHGINKKECKLRWMVGTRLSEYKQAHPMKFRYEFDVTSHGLEFTEAFEKTKQVADEPWVPGGIDSDGCASRAIASVVNRASAQSTERPAGIPKRLWDLALRGNADSQLLISTMYAKGTGVPQDYAEEYFWLDLAAAGRPQLMKPSDVAKLRDSAASHLTPTILLQEQARASQWFDDHPGSEK